MATLNFCLTKPFRYSFFINAFIISYNRQLKKNNIELNIELLSSLKSNNSNEFKGSKYNCDNPIICSVELWYKSSLLTNALCSSINIPYYHFLQPNQYYEGSKVLTNHEKKKAYKNDFDWGIIAKEGYPELVKKGVKLQKLNIRYYDFTQIFKRLDSENIYKDICCHYNDKGNTVLAEEISKVIIKDNK